MGKKKQTLLAGGLISTFGIFVSKFMGLLYVIPYYALLGQQSEYINYYAQSYNIYSYVLNIATAGLPFAIATLVARYVARGDFKTTLLIKKISFYLMAAFGFIGMLSMMILSGPIARVLVGASNGDVHIMQICLIILSVSIFIVAILSSERGYFQGLKQMTMYSKSQVIEQFVRVIFLLVFTYIAINVMGMETQWGVYAGVFAASVAAATCIVYIKNFERKNMKSLIAENPQTFTSNVTPKELLKELVILAIPFLLNAVFGMSDTIINQMFMGSGLSAHGFNAEQILAYQEAANAQAIKIIAIPMILAPGFIASVIPHITDSVERNDSKTVKKNILLSIETVVYIAIPICLAIFVFAKPILEVVFGISRKANIGETMNIYVETMKWFSIEAFLSTICPLLSSLVMTIGGRKEVVKYTMVFSIVKFATCYICIRLFGISGLILSSALGFAVLIPLLISYIQKRYHINWTFTLRKFVLMLVGAVAFMLVGLVFQKIGWIDNLNGRMMTLVRLGIMGIVSVGVYLGVTYALQLPQVIFGLDLKKIKRKLKK